MTITYATPITASTYVKHVWFLKMNFFASDTGIAKKYSETHCVGVQELLTESAGVTATATPPDVTDLVFARRAIMSGETIMLNAAVTNTAHNNISFPFFTSPKTGVLRSGSEGSLASIEDSDIPDRVLVFIKTSRIGRRGYARTPSIREGDILNNLLVPDLTFTASSYVPAFAAGSSAAVQYKDYMFAVLQNTIACSRPSKKGEKGKFLVCNWVNVQYKKLDARHLKNVISL